MLTVVDLLHERVRRGSRAPHGDGRSVALCVEGGAMRGVVSAGMVSALEELGLTDAFDAVYGSSAGAINAAYFVAGQARFGTRIYGEDINSARFISLARPLTGRPIVNLEFLLDEVIGRRKPLDTARVIASASPLTVMATNADTGQVVALRGFKNAAELLAALRAGASMPVMAGPAYAHPDGRFFDASLSEPIPVPTAEADGHTDIVVLLTRPGTMRPRPSAFDRHFVGPRLRRWSPPLADRYLSRAVPYAALMATLDGGWGPLGRARVMTIRTSVAVGKLERDAGRLARGAAEGRAAVLAAFAAVPSGPARIRA